MSALATCAYGINVTSLTAKWYIVASILSEKMKLIWQGICITLLLASCNLLFPRDYETPQAIDVSSSSFESPAGITNNGLLNVVSSWTPGGSWYEKFKSTIVPDGEYAIWSSNTHEGLMPENGWSQELPTIYAEGKNVLIVLTMALSHDFISVTTQAMIPIKYLIH